LITAALLMPTAMAVLLGSQHVGACFLDDALVRLQQLGFASGTKNQPHPFACQQLRRDKSDAIARSGNDRNFAGQTEIHRPSLLD
jgi:hypothetical protein